MSTETSHSSSGLRWWPLALGIAVAAGQAFGAGRGFAAIVLVCAVIYLFAAVTARPTFAWIGFAASLPLVGLAVVLRTEALSLALIGAAGIALVIVGMARGTWQRRVNRIQLVAAAAFGAVAVVAVAAPSVAGPLVIAGLLGHAAWDIVHHRRNAVVARPYAEFCAALDLALGILIAVLLLIPAG